MSGTVDITLNDEDGWVAVATDPVGLHIKSNGIGRWHFAAAADGQTPDAGLVGEVYESISARYVTSFIGTVYVRVDTDAHPFSVTPDIGASHTVQANGVPGSYTCITSNTSTVPLQRGNLNDISFFPRVLNEQQSNNQQVQASVTSTNIVGQILKPSADNISAIQFSAESAGAFVIDNFESYASNADLQTVWSSGGANLPELETNTALTGSKAMRLLSSANGEEFETTAFPSDYTGYTGKFSAVFTHAFSQLQMAVYIRDILGNSKSFILAQDGADILTDFSVLETAMVQDQPTDTDTTQVVAIGFRVLLKRVGGFMRVDDLSTAPPPGFLGIKLWDMGASIPDSGVDSIDSGTPFDKIGGLPVDEYILPLEPGLRIYHLEGFTAGVDKSAPDNVPVNPDNYYILELKWVDTDVNVYGADTSRGVNYYQSGFAFTAPDESTPIASLGEFADIMFGVMSTQPVYMLDVGWAFDSEPNGGSSILVHLKDRTGSISGTVIDHEANPEREFSTDLTARPMLLEDGGHLAFGYNDDPLDSVGRVRGEVRFLHEPPDVNG